MVYRTDLEVKTYHSVRHWTPSEMRARKVAGMFRWSYEASIAGDKRAPTRYGNSGIVECSHHEAVVAQGQHKLRFQPWHLQILNLTMRPSFGTSRRHREMWGSDKISLSLTRVVIISSSSIYTQKGP